jgi:electron transport complex protein RnfG
MSQPAAPQTPVVNTPAGAMLRTLSLVAGLSGFLVVLAYQLTEPLIEENKRIAIERALFKVIPGAVSRRDFMLAGTTITPADSDKAATGIRIYAGYDDQDQLAGIALEAAAQGYQDVIRILYSYDPACECIRGIEVLKMAETPGIGDKIAKDPAFLQNFEALDARLDAIISVKHGSKTEPWQIDAISGATISSKAVARMLNDTSQQVLPHLTRQLEQLHGSAGETP